MVKAGTVARFILSLGQFLSCEIFPRLTPTSQLNTTSFNLKMKFSLILTAIAAGTALASPIAKGAEPPSIYRREEDTRGGIPWKREEDTRGGIPWKREEDTRGGIPWKREEDTRGGIPWKRNDRGAY
jgi:hypothetical protein